MPITKATSPVYIFPSLRLLLFILFYMPGLCGNAQNPDAVYPIPGNYGSEITEGINLFTGNVGKTISLAEIKSVQLSYSLDAYYNSASAQLINSSASNFYFNPLGGYGWKIMDYPKLVQDGSNYYMLDGMAAYPLQSLGSNAYTPGGKYYLWRVMNKGNNQWEIAKEDGIHYIYNNAPVIQTNNSKVWNFSVMKHTLSGDSLVFGYNAAGNIVSINSAIGDTLQINYASIGGSSNQYLTQLTHRKNGQLISTINLSYIPYTSVNRTTYQLLSQIEHDHWISGTSYSQMNASTKFTYITQANAPPFHGANYSGALNSITTPSGAVYIYTYQSTRAAGVVGYYVAQYAISDGYNNNSGGVYDPYTYTAISYDTTNVMPGGNNVYRYYNLLSVAPGGRSDTSENDNHPYGTLEYYFLNGQPGATLIDLPDSYNAAAVTNPVLTGSLYQKKINHDSLAQNAQAEDILMIYYWNAGTLAPGNSGTFPKLVQTYDEKYGIGKWITYSYGTPYQLPVSIATARRNPEPVNPNVNRDSLITNITYTFQTYPALTADSIYYINNPSRIVNLVQEDMQGNFMVVDCSCIQWTQWNSNGLPGNPSGYWAPWKWIQMRSATADTAACLTTATTTTNKDWLLKGIVNQRGVFRVATDSSSGGSKTISKIITAAANGAGTVANFTNARTQTLSASRQANADYLGFESYEPSYNSRWTVSNGSTNTDYAHTGARSFSGNLSRTFSPADSAGRFYILGAWTRIAATGDSCIIQLKNSAGVVIASTTTSYQPNSASLKYIEASAFVAPGQSIQAVISTYGQSFVDDISFMPVDAEFEGAVYDINRNIQVARLGTNGATTHLVYNRFNALIADVGPGSIQNINNLRVPSNSRRGNRFVNGKDDFDPTYPNMSLDVSARSDGNWQGFEYQSNNSFPPANLSNMTIENEWLQATSSNASATFNHSIDTTHIGLYAEIYPNQLSAGQEIGFSLLLDSMDFNGNVINTRELKFVMTNQSLTLYSGNTVYETLPVSQVLNSTSLLLEVSNYNYFFGYANGRYVFEHEFQSGRIHGPVKLVTNNTGAAFDNFFYVANPSIYQETFDALNRPKQQLSRISKYELSITEVLYGGPMNLPMAQTRSAIIGGEGKDLGLSYKPDFASGFNSDSMTLSDSSILGAAADYKDPFSTSLQYAKIPTLDIVGIGGGGQFTAGPSNDHYTTFTYGQDAGNIFDYTSNELMVTTRTEPNGVKVFSYTNREMVPFGEARVDGTDTLRTQYEYDNHLRLSRTYQPNYYVKQLAGNQNFIQQFGYDYTGNKVMERNADAGASYFVYTPGGKLRFSIDSSGMAANPNNIVYAKYDGLGRITEQGIINMPWNRDSLQYYADSKKDYPSAANPGTTHYQWRNLFVYDGDGKAPNQGKLISAATNWDNDNSPEVTETYQYDLYGNIINKGLTVTDLDAKSRNITYKYDLQNRVTQIGFPGTSHPNIVYTYNDNNQLIAVGIPGNLDYYASYDYNYNTLEYLNNGSFVRTYSSNNAGWLTGINDTLFNEALSYGHSTASGIDSSYDYNGKIAQLYDTLKWSKLALKAGYTYDNNARITTADYGSANPWSLGLTTPVQYDNNGNIMNLQNGTSPPLVFQYNTGTNQTKTIQGFQQNYSYAGNGAITSVPYGVSNIMYDAVFQLTLSASYKQTTVSYQYNGGGQRVLKQAQTGAGQTKRLYVHGLNDYPLMEVSMNAAGVSTTTFYIYGPKGLIAIEQNDQRLFVLKDHLGSVRVVIDSTNKVKAYFNYSVFGNTMSSNIDSSISSIPLNYLYTGQEIEPELGGIYNYRARLYDPGTGRFYSPDMDAQYPNPYEYAGNNPVNFIDPSGNWSLWATIAVAAVSVIATAAVIITAPVSLPALAVAGLAVAAGTAAGVAAGAVTGTITGDGAGKGALYGLAIGAVASVATVGAVYLGAPGAALTRAGVFTPTAKALAATIAKVAVGAGVVSTLIGTLTGNNNSTPTPIDGTDYPRANIAITIIPNTIFIKKGEGKTITGLQGFYATFDLANATFVVPNSPTVYNCSTNPKNKNYCPGIPYNSPLFTLEDWNTRFADSRLKINANFFSIANITMRESPCTKIFGASVSDYQVVSAASARDIVGCPPPYNQYCTVDCGNLLDVFLVTYKRNPDGSTTKTASIVPNASVQDTLNTRLVQSAVAGGIIVKDGTVLKTSDMSSSLKPTNSGSRTAIGISQDGKTIIFLTIQTGSRNPGINASDLGLYMRYNLLCWNVINLDNSGSSQFIYNENNKIKYETIPGDVEGYRPIPNFIGVK